MRLLIAMLLVSTTLQAQSLADVARQERNRRVTQHVKARVFTTEGLARAARVLASETGSEPDQETGADTNREAASEEDLEAWEEAVDEQLSIVLDLEYQESLHQDGIAAYRELLADSSTIQSERNQAILNMAVEQAGLDALLPELEDARDVLEELDTRGPARRTTGGGL